ncbi:MAG: DUF721 domain-containing protein [Pirellulaceae bacterium]|nr:DUF721 domain-containing protein [Pirellulaceae bacterium]
MNERRHGTTNRNLEKVQENEIAKVAKYVQQNQRFSAMPKRIDNVVSRLMTRKGYAREQANDELIDVWKTIVGDSMVRDSRPGNFRRGTLQVSVRNSIVLQELTFRKRELMRELSRLLPQMKIQQIRFNVGNLD